MNLNEIADECHNIARDHGFWDECDQPWDVLWVLSRLALVHSEVSEALEEARKGDWPKFAEELADVMIRVFDLSGGMNVDLDEAVTAKMEKNRNRPHMHGKLA